MLDLGNLHVVFCEGLAVLVMALWRELAIGNAVEAHRAPVAPNHGLGDEYVDPRGLCTFGLFTAMDI